MAEKFIKQKMYGFNDKKVNKGHTFFFVIKTKVLIKLKINNKFDNFCENITFFFFIRQNTTQIHYK